jgi:hypothetical protein
MRDGRRKRGKRREGLEEREQREPRIMDEGRVAGGIRATGAW